MKNPTVSLMRLVSSLVKFTTNIVKHISLSVYHIDLVNFTGNRYPSPCTDSEKNRCIGFLFTTESVFFTLLIVKLTA